MTTREFNRRWNAHGITLEYNGYDLHDTVKTRKWTMSIGHYHQEIWGNLDNADEMAEEMLKCYAFIKEWNARNPHMQVSSNKEG